MSDPFRDGMQAALERAENLEDENEILRKEIAELRQRSEALRANVGAVPDEEHSPATRALAGKALEVLDQLEVVSQRGSQAAQQQRVFTPVAERALDAVAPTRLETSSSEEGVIDIPKPRQKPTPKPPDPREEARQRENARLAAWVFITAVVFAVMGYAVGSTH